MAENIRCENLSQNRFFFRYRSSSYLGFREESDITIHISRISSSMHQIRRDLPDGFEPVLARPACDSGIPDYSVYSLVSVEKLLRESFHGG